MTQKMKLVLFGVLMSLAGSGAWAVEPSAFTQTVQSETNGLTLTLQVDLTQLKYDPANGGALTLPGCQTIPMPGGWAVPTLNLDVILPPNVFVTALDVLPATEPVSGVDLALQPTPRAPHDCPTPDPVPSAPAIFPDAWAALGTASYHHGVHVQTIRVSPVRLDFLANQVVGARQMVIRLTWQPTPTPDIFVIPKTSHPEAQRVRAALKATAVNGANLDALTDVAVAKALAVNGIVSATYLPKSPTGTVEGVIICPADNVKYWQPLADEKTRQGHPWDIVTYEWIYAQPGYFPESDSDQARAIRAFLIEAYQRYGLMDVIFGGVEPPPVPATWYVSGVALMPQDPSHSLGYYTNLDGGDHDVCTANLSKTEQFVTLRNPDEFPTGWMVGEVLRTNLGSQVRQVIRCGLPLATIRWEEMIRNTEWPLWEMYDHNDYAGMKAWVRAHPEWWGVRMLRVTTNREDRSAACDISPELFAGWLPQHPSLGPVSVGLYVEKLRRYREPRDPSRSGLIMNQRFHFDSSNMDVLRDAMVASGLTRVSLRELGGYLDREPYMTTFRNGGADIAFSHACAGDGIPSIVMVDSNNARLALLDQASSPSGLVVHPVCLFRGGTFQSDALGPIGSNLPSSGSLWQRPLTNMVLHPDGGPVAALYAGIEGQFPTGPEPFGMFDFPVVSIHLPSLLQAHQPLSRMIQWYTTNGWSKGHKSIYVGDPTVRAWTAPPERLVVVHPAQALETFDVTVTYGQNQPLPGAGVTVSKRRPDGTYAFYQRVITNANGVATFTPGDVTALGTGVLAVEVDSFPNVPLRDFYPYHGRMPLPTNTPPTVVTNLPTEILQTTAQGSWVILDAGESFDPDGDPVDFTWTWMDNRTGASVIRTETGRYLRAFLPPGTNPIIVTVADGQASSTSRLTLTVKDVDPPVVGLTWPRNLMQWHTWATVPVRVNHQVSGGLNFTASDAFPGIGGWTVTEVTSNDPREPAPVTFTLLPTQDLVVYAEENPDGSARVYTVTVRVHDTVGNATTCSGRITVVPGTPTLSSPNVAVLQQADWVEIPITVNDSYNYEGLNFSPYNARGLVGWRVTGVQADETRQPAPVTCTLQGNMVRVLTEGNEELATRRYLVSVEAWNTLGLTATATGEIGVIPLALATRDPRKVQGQVGQGRQNPSGEFLVPPVILIPEPTTIVQFTSPDGDEIVRARVEADGRWTAWLPYSEMWNVQATRGGRSLFAYDFSPTFQALSVAAGRDNSSYQRFPETARFVSRARSSGNQPPVAYVVPIGAAASPVTLDGRPSSDPDGDLLMYTWTWTQNRTAYRRSGPIVSAPLPLGSTTVTLTVSDGTASTTKIFTVSVVKPSTVIQAVE